MKYYVNKLKIEKKINKVVCNICGKEIIPHNESEEYISIKKTWGYGSSKDGATYEFDMCEKCFDALISTMIIPPRIKK